MTEWRGVKCMAMNTSWTQRHNLTWAPVYSGVWTISWNISCDASQSLMPFWDWWRSWRFITNHSVLLFLIVASKRQQAFVFYFLPGLHLFLLVLSLLASVTFLLLAGAGRDALEFIFRWALGWFLEQNFTVGWRVIACGRGEDASSAQRGGLRRPFFNLLFLDEGCQTCSGTNISKTSLIFQINHKRVLL